MSDLDELMARDPLELSDVDIEAIIRYHRQRKDRTTTFTPEGSKTVIDKLRSKLMAAPAPTPTPVPKPMRRI